jgi:hypothetical protein
MMNKQPHMNQPTQPIPVITLKKETQRERFLRLKRMADETGKRFIHVYLEDERRRKRTRDDVPLVRWDHVRS